MSGVGDLLISPLLNLLYWAAGFLASPLKNRGNDGLRSVIDNNSMLRLWTRADFDRRDHMGAFHAGAKASTSAQRSEVVVLSRDHANREGFDGTPRFCAVLAASKISGKALRNRGITRPARTVVCLLKQGRSQ